MFFGICGLGLVVLGILVKHPNVTTIGFGFIGVDIVLELSTLNTNLRVLIQNVRVLLTKILEIKK